MTSETAFCDHCGLYSSIGPFCQNCGAPLQKLSPDQIKFALPRWGRIVIHRIEESTTDIKADLVRIWQKLENETEQSLWPSQMSKLQSFTGRIELYGSELSAHALNEQLRGKLVVDFQELPDSELPRKPSTPVLRKA